MSVKMQKLWKWRNEEFGRMTFLERWDFTTATVMFPTALSTNLINIFKSGETMKSSCWCGETCAPRPAATVTLMVVNGFRFNVNGCGVSLLHQWLWFGNCGGDATTYPGMTQLNGTIIITKE
jgi:hypothetical protein